MKRKLLYCVGADLPSQNASSVHAYRMSSALSKSFDVLFHAKFSNSKEGIVAFYGESNDSSFSRGSFSPVFRFLELLYAINKVDVVYSRWYYSLFLLLFFKNKFYFEFHTLPYGRFSRYAVRFLNKIMKHRDVEIVCISKQLKDDLVRFYGANFNEAIVAHDASSNINICEAGKTYDVGYVGSLKPGKGVERVVSIANELPDVSFVVYGGTQKEIALLKPHIKNDNVYLKGFIEAAKISEAYSSFKIGILPNYPSVYIGGNDIGKWTSPLKLFEYMAAKRPVVLTDLPVLREVLIHNSTGIFCDTDKMDDWVSSIRLLLADSNFYECIANSAYDEYLKKYSWDARVKLIFDR
jgi:glycosyltransferase involved in cell wall biosynthesis